jgi:hypothetical protein
VAKYVGAAIPVSVTAPWFQHPMLGYVFTGAVLYSLR